MNKFSLLFPDFSDKVEFGYLRDVATFKRGKTVSQTKMKKGNIPFIAAGRTPSCYVDSPNLTTECCTVASSGSAGFVSYWNEPIFLSDAFAVIPNENIILAKYMFYFLKNMQEEIYSMQVGAVKPHIYPYHLQSIKIPLPPPDEQKAIADYLDKKCEQIERFIAKKEKLIALLKEKRQSLISEAVCRGLDKNKKYKNSGIEWLGLIPAHWKLLPLQAVFRDRNESNQNKKISLILSLIKDVGVIPYAEKGDIGNKSKDDLSQYKIARKNDIVLNKMNAVIGSIGLSHYDGLVSPIYLVLTLLDSNYNAPSYFARMFEIKPLQESLSQYATGIMKIRESIDFLDFKKMKIPVPPLDEQKAIVDYLDKKLAQVDTLSTRIYAQINLMKEYKTTLISEAVCGRLEKKSRNTQ